MKASRRRGYRTAIIVGVAAAALGGYLVLKEDPYRRDGKEALAPPSPVTSFAPSGRFARPWSYPDFVAEPIDDAVMVSWHEAREVSGFPLLMPNHALANRSNLETVWFSPSSRQVALVFETTIVIVEEIPQFPDSAETLTAIVNDTPQGARMEAVGDSPALVFEPETDPQADNPGVVHFVRGDDRPEVTDGVSATLYGDRVSGDTLLEIAETME